MRCPHCNSTEVIIRPQLWFNKREGKIIVAEHIWDCQTCRGYHCQPISQAALEDILNKRGRAA